MHCKTTRVGERILPERSCSYVAQGQKTYGGLLVICCHFYTVCGSSMLCPQEYEEASEAFQDGLELDPGNAEMEKLLW
jgi:hypothetical protein